jgi:hypothetical protein
LPPRRILTPRVSSTLAALLFALVVAGCGGGNGGEREQVEPRLPLQLAAELAEQSDVVAERLEANDPCGARAEAEALQQRTITAVNDGRVPPRYQEELTSTVGALLASIECAPAEPPPPTVEEPPPPTVEEPPPPTVEEPDEEETDDEDDEENEGQGKGDRGQSGKGGGKGGGEGGGKGKGKGRRQ